MKNFICVLMLMAGATGVLGQAPDTLWTSAEYPIGTPALGITAPRTNGSGSLDDLIELGYDDGSAEQWYRVTSPNLSQDYFAVKFTPPSSDSVIYPLWIRSCSVFMERNDPLPNVWLCPMNELGFPDMSNPYLHWTNIGADGSPGWLVAQAIDTTLLPDESDFWVIWQFPPGQTGPGTGSDQSSPDLRSYWTWENTYPNWNLWSSHDWMCRVVLETFLASSQGFLSLVRSSAQGTPVLSWSAGSLECPMDLITEIFRLKNFGGDSIIVFQPLEPVSSEFLRATNCGGFFALAPGQMSACSLTLTFNPASDGNYYDTLLIQTDAVNQQGGYVRIPLSGEQISTPATPQVVIDVSGEDAVLHWGPVTQSVGGCPVNVTRYLVFYSPTSGGPYYYHGWTADTTYTHEGVITYASGMFYEVTAVTGSVNVSRLVEGMTREEVEERILPYRQKFGLEN